MKNFRKKTGLILVFAALAACFLQGTVLAAGCQIKAGAVSGRPGETVTVTITMTEVMAGSFQVTANYEPDELEFVSAKEGNAGENLKNRTLTDPNNGGKQGEVTYAATTDDIKNEKCVGTIMSITFEILKASGVSDITLKNVRVYEAIGNPPKVVPVTPVDGKVEIQSPPTEPTTSPKPTEPTTSPKPTEPTTSPKPPIPPAPPKSSDASLKSLVVRGVTEAGYTTAVKLSPAFSPRVTKYRATVAADVIRLAVTPETNDPKAVCSIPQALLKINVGDNQTRVTVTAEDGTKRTYIIYTEKKKTGESVTEPVTDETFTEPLTEPEEEITAEPPETEPLTEPTSDEPPEEPTTEVWGPQNGGSQKRVRDIKLLRLGLIFSALAVLSLAGGIVVLIFEKDKSQGES